MKAVIAVVGLSALLSACAPAPLTALFASCPASLADDGTPPPLLTPDGRITLESPKTEP